MIGSLLFIVTKYTWNAPPLELDRLGLGNVIQFVTRGKTKYDTQLYFRQ
jgi:hypothetical protein